MADGYLLSQRDRDDLERLLRDFRARRVNPLRPGHGAIDHQETTTPEVYVARVPAGGIPALDLNSQVLYTGTGTGTPLESGTGTGTGYTDDTPGVAECQIYRLLPDDTMEASGFTRRVYNLGLDDVTPDDTPWVIVTRDKYGYWYATAPGGLGVRRSKSFTVYRYTCGTGDLIETAYTVTVSGINLELTVT